ncbi:MAG: thioredoxin family protein [Epsilonproteobacteria bacterium]|nr:thioredoxin family protein [Campylobacterota bacterium]
MNEEVNSLETLQALLEKEIGVLLYFSTPTCNVCHALKPKIAAEFERHFPKIKQVFIDSTLTPEIPAHFQVFSVPTILVFLEGKEFARESRNVSVPKLTDHIGRVYNLLTS